MHLKNILIVVKDIEKSKRFYKELFGLEVVADFGENVVLTEGLVLQEKNLWETFIGKEAIEGGNAAELYFEENDIETFLKKLDSSSFEIEYLNRCKEDDWGRRVIHIYDPDRHVIEIGEKGHGMDTGIKDRVLQEIRALAEQYKIQKVILFGSRARGDYHKTSDIDLAVSGGNITAFTIDVDEETYTLLKFDVVNLDGPVQEELRKSIEEEGIVIYEKI